MIPVTKLFSVQEHSGSLSTYTLKGIEFLEKVGGFVKERAALEEEYGNKLRSLSRKYTKRYDDDEILKHSTFLQSFNNCMQQMEIIANHHCSMSDSLKTEVFEYINSKCVQHKSARKNTMHDLSTIDDDLNNVINELFKAKKLYFRAFKEAEVAYQKYQKADKNMDISRTELQKARTFSEQKIDTCEKLKSEYSQSVECANYGQDKYFDKLLPMIFCRLKVIDNERIEDTKEVIKKCLKIDRDCQESIEECWKKSGKFADYIDPETDSTMILKTVQSKIDRSASFELDDLGDPKIGCNRPIDYMERVEAYLSPIYKRKDSPIKMRSFRQLFRGKERIDGKTNSEDEEYSDLPPKVRLRCLNARIKKLEKELETATQGREGLNRLQNAYRENPKLGNPSDCNESLVQHAKEIERLTIRIENLRVLCTDVECAIIEAGDFTDRSFGGRDSTIDSTRSMSGCSTNISSKTNTIDEAGLYSDGTSDSVPHLSNDMRFSSKSANSSPLRPSKTPISSPFRTNSLRQQKCGGTPQKRVELGRGVVMFAFEGNSYGTISVKEGDNVLLMEKGDDKDGWMKIRRISENNKEGEEGFVPTSYLKCTWNL